MKKIWIILAVILLILILFVALAPAFFSEGVGRIVVNQAEKKLNAHIGFNGLSLSLIKNFPRTTLSIDSLQIIPLEPFAKDTLLQSERITATVDLLSYFRNKRLSIDGLEITRPDIRLVVNGEGKTNWEITKSAPSSEPDAAGLAFELKRYSINRGIISYTDAARGNRVQLDNFTHQGSGNFSAKQFVLDTRTTIDSTDIIFQGNKYLNRADFNADLRLDVDLEKQLFHLRENTVRVNQVVLNFAGWYGMQDGKPQVDVTFNSPETDFKQILSLIPVLYRNKFAELQASGQMAFTGHVHGPIGDGIIPRFEINLDVNNGAFSYAARPARMTNVQLDMAVNNPGTTADDVVVQLRSLHFELNDQPMDLTLQLKTPVSRPWIDTRIKGILDLGQLGQLIVLPSGTILRGRVDADLALQGLVSKQELADLTGSGFLQMDNVYYASPALPQPLQVSRSLIKVASPRLRLESFEAAMGRSDLSANGFLVNPLGFLFANQTLNGTLTVSSRTLDLDPFIEAPSAGLQAFELPDRVHFQMKADLGRVLMQGMEFTKLKGDLLLSGKVLKLNGVKADFANGSLTADGSYRWLPPAKPALDFNFEADAVRLNGLLQIAIPPLIAPFLNHLSGNFDGTIQLNSALEKSLLPVWESFFNRGNLSITQVSVAAAPLLQKLADAVQINRLRNPTLQGLNPRYTIQDGRFNVRPFSFTLGDYTFELAGSHGVDMTLDYTLQAAIPAESAEARLNPLLAKYLGGAAGLLKGRRLTMDIAITGTAENPRFNTSIAEALGDTLKQAVQTEAETRIDSLKQKTQEKLEEKKEEIADKANARLKDILDSRKKQ